MGSGMSKADLIKRNEYLEKKLADEEKYERHVRAVLHEIPGNLAYFAEHHPEQAFQIYNLKTRSINTAATPKDIATYLVEFVKWGMETDKNKIIVNVQRAEM